ncbi:hypothetical protein [Nitrosopumilus sp.]|nr:hypothetical protein [Nitrosopumilus sp.]
MTTVIMEKSIMQKESKNNDLPPEEISEIQESYSDSEKPKNLKLLKN